MPAPKLPRAEILQWLSDGLTQAQVVERLASRGITATQTAVSRIKVTYGDQRGLTPGVPRTHFIPWKLEPQHRSRYAAQMLRALDRVQRGEELSALQARQLRNWVGSMNEDNLSIDYDPASEAGFIKVPRREGETLVRYPEGVAAHV